MELLERLSTAVGGRYRPERELGRGGMAVVFLAEDLRHHRPVAIKVLNPELTADLGGERFLREIETAAALQHPNIVPLFDSGHAAGLLYYVMPFVAGESLRQRLAREPQLPLEEALRITREVGSALQYAHEHGVVHRDIKPENVLISGGHAMVADFGIARALDAASGRSLTQTGIVVGTPHYMSPEQAGGAAVDGRSDQYSLACTLYEMLAGEPPFGGPTAQAVLARHASAPVPSLRVVRQQVPAAVEGAIQQAMAKVPADRFPTIQRFVDTLDAPHVATEAPTLASMPRVRSAARPVARVIALIAVGALVAATTWALRSGWFGSRGGARVVTPVAVLPFEDPATGPDSSYLARGVREGLVAELAGIGSFKVISGASDAAAGHSAESLARLGSELGVTAVVTGVVRRTGDGVQVSVRFVRARDNSLLFAKEYEGRLGDLPDLQRQITLAISDAAHARFDEPERRRLEVRREVDPKAYEAYLRGRFELEHDQPEEARAAFELASRIAPDWAPPYVGLAQYWTSLPFFRDVPPATVLPTARGLLVRALELDETLAEAHAALAYVRAYFEWDWRAAEQEFRRALELRPSYPDAYFSYSRFLVSRSRHDEAIAQLERAVELDPLSLSLQANRALLEYFAGRYVTADSGLRVVLRRDSSDVLSRWGLSLVQEQQGQFDGAIANLERVAGASLNRRASLGHLYAVAGKPAKARAVLAALRAEEDRQFVPSYYFALIHAGLGDRAAALRELERAYAERSTVIAYLLVDPRLDPLRKEPRFLALARQLRGE